ncbi:transport protein Trs120 or TRAPPC9 TRAPP II complex subunit-domain-containing protein [Lentinula edodes]|nr:transport protein Trs120 or TRAPPC9 TRAPP II complex subunit-domain-containing protein [Lentinula edodes]
MELQLSLKIRRTTVTHGALMLYDGEMFPIGIRFENIPPLPIDFIQLAFDDSTMTPAQEALTEGELSVFETYETEYALIHRPVFFWIKNDSVAIAPGRNVTLTINCFGKEGTIHASYSYIHRDPFDNEEASVFHTGQLSYPLMITVYRMLESHEMDILPYPYPTGTDDNLVINKSNLFVQDNGAWCLFSVDIMNRYGIPFEVSIERIQEDVPWGKTLVNVPPGSTSRYNVGQSVYAKLNTLCRLVIPLEKFLSGDEHISRPIPSLCDRQFVVDKTKLSDAEQKMQRKLFCYGEELFKCLRCRWREAGETRYGDLSLRNQRLTLTMLKTLLKPIEQSAGKYHLPCSERVYLHIKVTNFTETTLVFTLDVNKDLHEHVIDDGILCAIRVDRLEAKESREVEVAVCFLCHGRFEALASTRVLDCSGSSSETGSARLIVMVNTDA